MTVSPQYFPFNPEHYIVGRQQEKPTETMQRTGGLLAVFVLMPFISFTGGTALRAWEQIPFFLLLCLPVVIVMLIIFLVIRRKGPSCWVEGGYYIDYRYNNKKPIIRIYYKDIVCWSGQADNWYIGRNYARTTVFDRFGQRIEVNDTLAFPHLFRYLIENNVPAHMNSPVKTVVFLQERYQKSWERAVFELQRGQSGPQ